MRWPGRAATLLLATSGCFPTSGGVPSGSDAATSCAIDRGGCDAHADCDDAGGLIVCTCQPGWTGDGLTCADVDECATGNGGCDLATCTNTDGGRTCGPCPTGTTGPAETGCLADAPRVWSVTPKSVPGATASAEVILSGVDFFETAEVWLDDVPVPTTYVDAGSVLATLDAAALATVGDRALTVRNRPGALGAPSNVAWLVREGAAAAPRVVEVVPGWAAPGDKVRLLGRFAGTTLTVTDGNGSTATALPTDPPTWPTAADEAFAFVVPDGWVSGPLRVVDDALSYRTRSLTVGANLAVVPAAMADASTQFNNRWSRFNLNDGLLEESWFAALGDCASLPACTSVPWVEVRLPNDAAVTEVVIYGNREYPNGYDVFAGAVELYDASDVLLATQRLVLDRPHSDGAAAFPAPVAHVRRVRFALEIDESNEPGLAELVVIGAFE